MGIKQSMFDVVQNDYGLQFLKLIKAAVTCWLSHGKEAKQRIDQSESLVAALDAICQEIQACSLRCVR